ncbi:hypothetical protein E1301_Tti009710 [Triplophysa tibetana]|uniref:Uncharacterized protein n=1 Tax=Triplophysa tibetana TaxID=1572043 RepID=A0A5A9NCU5_9TELE|nr:hypothetical protein E1301_Tti009710 [Triplophysa tibetana]
MEVLGSIRDCSPVGRSSGAGAESLKQQRKTNREDPVCTHICLLQHFPGGTADTEPARVQLQLNKKSTASVIARAPLIAVSAFICDVGRTFHFYEFIRYKTCLCASFVDIKMSSHCRRLQIHAESGSEMRRTPVPPGARQRYCRSTSMDFNTTFLTKVKIKSSQPFTNVREGRGDSDDTSDQVLYNRKQACLHSLIENLIWRVRATTSPLSLILWLDSCFLVQERRS